MYNECQSVTASNDDNTRIVASSSLRLAFLLEGQNDRRGRFQKMSRSHHPIANDDENVGDGEHKATCRRRMLLLIAPVQSAAKSVVRGVALNV